MDPTKPKMPLETVASELLAPLSRYLRRYAGDRPIADDLLQTTMIRVLRGLPAFEGRANLTTWAFAIATRVAVDHFRHPEHRRDIVDIFDLGDGEEPVDGDRLAEEKLVIGEMNACVREVIDSLPEDYRAALVLHDLEEMSVRQVAEVCGITIATAKVRIHRARNRLREALRTQCAFYRDEDDVFRCDRKPEAPRSGWRVE